MLKLLAFGALIAALIVIGYFALMERRADHDADAPPARDETATANDEDAPTDTLAAIRAPLAGKLDATRLPMARIELEALDRDDPLASKLGGTPYLPRGETLPTSPDGKTLVLLAQINFSEAPRLPGYPSEGLLQIFIADDDLYGADLDRKYGDESTLAEQKKFRTRYYPAPLLPASELTGVAPGPGEMLPLNPTRPRRMRFVAAEEEMSWQDVHFKQATGVDAYDFATERAESLGIDENKALDAFDSGFGHKLGGYPAFTQEDPRDPTSRLRLLLQLDTDDDAAMMWGDAGVANFFIDPEDLAKADFSRVLYNWDCH